MRRTMLKAKIQKLVVTETNLDYEGSLTLDESLMRAVDMIPFEQVHIYNISNGERFSTYLIKGLENSGVVGVNGAAVHKAKTGDKLIVASYVSLDEEEKDFFMPKILIVDEKNRIKEVK
jgi:aspartate 1-decarboxylase